MKLREGSYRKAYNNIWVHCATSPCFHVGNEDNHDQYFNNSDWGAGEFLLMRTSFELEALDYDHYRISVLARQGFHIYLNGHKIHTCVWWKDMPHYRLIMLSANETRYLRKGANTLAVYANVEYQKEEPQGQIDVFLEGLRKKDLDVR